MSGEVILAQSEWEKITKGVEQIKQGLDLLGSAKRTTVADATGMQKGVNPPAAAQAIGGPSRFALGRKSEAELHGVHPKLVKCVRLAISITTVDFRVFDGLRTPQEQEANIAKGVSKTRDSFHLVQADGWGHAVDLVPIIGGVLKWDWQGCYQIALAMDVAATQLGISNEITWGGAWDRTLADMREAGGPSEYARQVLEYQQRHAGPDFIDGPHFQLAR